MRANQSQHFCSGFPLKSYCLTKDADLFISLDHRMKLSEMFLTERHKSKTKVIILANNNRYQVSNEQIKVETNTYNWRHWLKKWREFCYPTTKRIKADLTTKMTLDTQVKYPPLLT